MTVLLPPHLLAIMRRGVSVNVASRDAALRPSLARAMGSDVSETGDRITVYLARSQAAQVLQDLASTGRIAVVFSEPATHLSIQVKAHSVQLRPAVAQDQPLLDRYVASMDIELARVGFAGPYTRALFAAKLEDLVAASFTPQEAWDQTPGARSGNLLGGAP